MYTCAYMCMVFVSIALLFDIKKFLFQLFLFHFFSVFYKGDYCEPSDLMGKEEGGIAVLTGRKVFAQ